MIKDAGIIVWEFGARTSSDAWFRAVAVFGTMVAMVDESREPQLKS